MTVLTHGLHVPPALSFFIDVEIDTLVSSIALGSGGVHAWSIRLVLTVEVWKSSRLLFHEDVFSHMYPYSVLRDVVVVIHIAGSYRFTKKRGSSFIAEVSHPYIS